MIGGGCDLATTWVGRAGKSLMPFSFSPVTSLDFLLVQLGWLLLLLLLLFWMDVLVCCLFTIVCFEIIVVQRSHRQRRLSWTWEIANVFSTIILNPNQNMTKRKRMSWRSQKEGQQRILPHPTTWRGVFPSPWWRSRLGNKRCLMNSMLELKRMMPENEK